MLILKKRRVKYTLVEDRLSLKGCHHLIRVSNVVNSFIFYMILYFDKGRNDYDYSLVLTTLII